MILHKSVRSRTLIKRTNKQKKNHPQRQTQQQKEMLRISSPSLQHVVTTTSSRKEDARKSKKSRPPGTWFFCSLVYLFLPWDLLSVQTPLRSSSTARRWAPTVAQCPACLWACAARGKLALGPCSRWLNRRSDQNCAPSHGPSRWRPSAPPAVHRKRDVTLRRWEGVGHVS